MMEMMLLLAKNLPFEMLVSLLEDGLAEYKVTQDKHKLYLPCLMIHSRAATEGMSNQEILKMSDEASAISNLLKQNKS